MYMPVFPVMPPCSSYALCTYCLQVSTVGIMPFFVENVSTLQISAMKLIRSVSPLLPISTVTLLASLCCKLSSGVFQV